MRRYMLTEVEVVSGIVLRTDIKRLQRDEVVKEASRFVPSFVPRRIFPERAEADPLNFLNL
jgi:hypothetical protein